MPQDAVVAGGLQKSFGETPALAGIDLTVREGEVFGVLGPNGAGKTTLIRILTTLLAPDAGRAAVAGCDVVRQAQQVREAIGVTGQGTSLAEVLTGRENLMLFGRLRGLDRVTSRRRADDLLDGFDLTGAGDRQVATYSGGMRRRLDVAASLLGEPPVLFLDEPTTGLDPRSRNGLWSQIEGLGARGITVVLTTQYLEEADRLADRVAIIDRGRIVAEDTPTGLKRSVGGTSLHVAATDPADINHVADQLATVVDSEMTIDRTEGVLRIPVAPGSSLAGEVIRHLSETGTDIADVSLRQPSLDEVFLTRTGHTPPDGLDATDTHHTAARPEEIHR
jgi:daunorubicin resistance ABC transporter ATP-binding subunit